MHVFSVAHGRPDAAKYLDLREDDRWRNPNILSSNGSVLCAMLCHHDDLGHVAQYCTMTISFPNCSVRDDDRE